MPTPALIALDWGTSNLRASLLDASGQVLSHRSSPGGVMKVPAGEFSARLLQVCGDWLAQHAVPVIASGMVGSRQGWKEAPYLSCPAGLQELAAALMEVEIEGAPGATRTLHIAPGLCCEDAVGQVDVMRGEETQLLGSGLNQSGLCVLPGTHSKWVVLGEQGGVIGFRTYMTGELFGVLTQHSILGRLMQWPDSPQALDPAAFAAGLDLGRVAGDHLSHSLFAARTAGLMGRWSATQLPDFLSGILLGSEVASALSVLPEPREVALLGDEPLCARYALALKAQGVASRVLAQEATTLGQFRMAQAAGLLARTP